MDCTDNIYCANGELNVYTVHGYRIDMYPDTVFTVLFYYSSKQNTGRDNSPANTAPDEDSSKTEE